jgi:hypothetical protein
MKVQLSQNPDVLGKIQVQMSRNQQHKIYQKRLSLPRGKKRVGLCYHLSSPDKPIVCFESAQAFLFAWYVSIKFLTIVQAICAKFPRFFRLFFYILVAGIYVTKTVKKYLQFLYIFADLLPVKCLQCLTNCLLPQSIFLKIVYSMPVQ